MRERERGIVREDGNNNNGESDEKIEGRGRVCTQSPLRQRILSVDNQWKRTEKGTFIPGTHWVYHTSYKQETNQVGSRNQQISIFF